MSSSELALSVRGLGKAYTIVHQASRRSTLAEQVLDWIGNPFRQLPKERFWALRDVSFDVSQGEVLGIIGRNGAGKSTLLKILSRITEPTTGMAELYGRTGSLLEVGTGFHRELTGRENIYLNGAILGMTRAEIDRRFDEIVDFAGTARFLDTPVKRYSSGMYVRLAFAVAAHLDPEILIVDEVLAVGDAEFQKKCLGKMGEVARGGRTVLFVSHNMNAVLNLCSRAIFLASGQIVADGHTGGVVQRYLASDRGTDGFQPDLGIRGGDGTAQITNFQVRPDPARTGAPAEFVCEISRPDTEQGAIPGEISIDVMTDDGTPVLQLYSIHMGRNFMLPPGLTRVTAAVEQLPLTPGTYRIGLWLGIGDHGIDHIQSCYRLHVLPGGMLEGVYVDNRGFPLVVPSSWRTAGERATVQMVG